MATTKCENCGKEYELEYNENLTEFQCECGGNLHFKDVNSVNKIIELIPDKNHRLLVFGLFAITILEIVYRFLLLLGIDYFIAFLIVFLFIPITIGYDLPLKKIHKYIPILSLYFVFYEKLIIFLSLGYWFPKLTNDILPDIVGWTIVFLIMAYIGNFIRKIVESRKNVVK